jgi:flagellin
LGDVVKAINDASSKTGVYASRASTNTATATFVSPMGNSTVSINGKAISVSMMDTAASFADKVNAASSSTGVSAVATGNSLAFSSAGAADFAIVDDPAMMSGVLQNFNNITTARGTSATFSAGIELSSQTMGASIAVGENGGTTAADLQIKTPGISFATTANLGTIFLSNGQSASYSNVVIDSLELINSSSATFNNVYVKNLSVFNNSTVAATASIIGSATLINSSVLALTGSASGSVSSNNSSTFSNASPVAAASPSMPAIKSSTVSGIDVSSQAGAQGAIETVDAALGEVSMASAKLGALQNRFSATVSNLQTLSQNLSSSRSAIQDADFASETASLSRAQVLGQAAGAVLAQANQSSSVVLSLLR